MLLIAPPVGYILMIAFGAWWLILMATENMRREMARKSLNAAHEFECACMDEEYAEHCQAIEKANRQMTGAWEVERSVLAAKHQRLCKRIDVENYRQLSAWEEADRRRLTKFNEECREVDATNRRLIMQWASADLARKAEHARVCATIDAANGELLAAWEAENAAKTAEHQRERDEVEQANRCVLTAWEAENAAKTAEHQRECDEIEQANFRQLVMAAIDEIEHQRERDEVEKANRRVLAAWEAENASRQAAYDQESREIEQKNQRLTSAWEALKATRQAEYERACREVDAKNRRLIADWEAANLPWVAEEKRWHDRVGNAEAEILRLESELNRQRTVTEGRFRMRKYDAGGIAAMHSRSKLDYERELRQAEIDSKKIQLDEHLDKALIRQAKLKGITGERILSLESFGIETAKDVSMLNNLKVPGIGLVLSKRLFDWRNSLVASFRPQQTLPDSEKNRIASRYAPIMLPLGQSIEGAINDLGTIAMSHRSREAEMIKAIAAAVQNLAVAEAYVRAMKVA